MDYTPKKLISTVFGFGGMCGAIGGMLMTQLVGYILTISDNRYFLLFLIIPVAYFAALIWLFFMAPREVDV